MGFIKRRTEPESPPVAMVVGLGNPGAQYSGTRHNVGFEVVEALADQHKIKLKTFKHQAQYGIGTIEGKSVLIVKPLTYMNLSGRSVSALAKLASIKPENILVIADDLDLDVAKVKLRAKGRSGGHNGHKSIIQALGTEEYPRIKIGIGKSSDTIDHVLSRFDRGERELISEAIRRSIRGIEVWLERGIDQAMNELNRSSDQDGLD